MSSNDKALDEIKSIMAIAVLELRDVIDNNFNQRVNFVEVLCMFLHGIIETTADFAELSSPGAKQSIYAEIEAWAKRGGGRPEC